MSFKITLRGCREGTVSFILLTLKMEGENDLLELTQTGRLRISSLLSSPAGFHTLPLKHSKKDPGKEKKENYQRPKWLHITLPGSGL